MFEEYANHPDIPGVFNPNTNQIYLRKNILAASVEEALNVYLHEANHQVTGLDDFSRGFADNLCKMLSGLLLRYASEVGVKVTARISETEIHISFQYPAASVHYASIIGIRNRLYIITPVCTVEAELPIILTSPICGMKKVTLKKQGFSLRLPGKLISALDYSSLDNSLNCLVKSNGAIKSSLLEA